VSGENLEREIFEQPEVLDELIKNEAQNTKALAKALQGSFSYVIIAARGTSDNAARYAKYLFGAYNQLPVALATPSLFTLYHQPPVMQGALVMGISQSGRSPDIVSVLEEGQRQGRPTLAITNDLDSPLAKAADFVIQLHTGPELAVAATKTYTASLAALALLSSSLDSDTKKMAQLQKLPKVMRTMLEGISKLQHRFERYRYMEQCAVIGRGYNYATAFEISLKIKELTRSLAEPYSSADFLHGPIAMVYRGFPVIVIAPHGSVLEDMRALIQRLTELQAELILISDENELLEQAHLALPMPSEIPEWLSPLIAVLPGQLMSLAIARSRGLDPDQPSGLTKVTETW
jgi:glucosamine--fructose-6-phosphate aminotransferase (isomerizing)